MGVNGNAGKLGPGPGFCILPSAAVFDPLLSLAALRVLAALATYADRDRMCSPAQRTLARRLSLSLRAINGAVAQLVECNYVELARRGLKGGKGGRTSNVYRLLFDTHGEPVMRTPMRSSDQVTRTDTRITTTPVDDLHAPDCAQPVTRTDVRRLSAPDCALSVSLLTGSAPTSVSALEDPQKQSEQERATRADPEPSAARKTPAPAEPDLGPEQRDLWERVKQVLAADGTISKAQREL